MDNRQYPKVRKAAERKGWIVRPTKKGEMFYAPDGVTMVLWHHTPSGHRALDNHVTRLRRAGFVWPVRGKR